MLGGRFRGRLLVIVRRMLRWWWGGVCWGREVERLMELLIKTSKDLFHFFHWGANFYLTL